MHELMFQAGARVTRGMHDASIVLLSSTLDYAACMMFVESSVMSCNF